MHRQSIVPTLAYGIPQISRQAILPTLPPVSGVICVLTGPALAAATRCAHDAFRVIMARGPRLCNPPTPSVD